MSAPEPPAAPQGERAFAVEATPPGAQTLVPGVVPITPLDRLLLRAAAPLEAKKPQRPCDLGLFDLNARAQLNLFDPLPPPEPGSG